VICTTCIALFFAIRHFTAREIVQRELDSAAAKEIAEYGLEQALINLSQDPFWNQGFKNIVHKTGFYNVVVAQVADSEYQVITTGRAGKMKKEIPCRYFIAAKDGVVKARGLKCE